jgi:hypothetical protein
MLPRKAWEVRGAKLHVAHEGVIHRGVPTVETAAFRHDLAGKEERRIVENSEVHAFAGEQRR